MRPPRKVELANTALADLIEIGAFIVDRRASLKVARAYTARIRDACERIGDAPLGGRLRLEAGHEVRGWTVERRTLILYRVTRSGVTVLRILHGGRQLNGPIPDDHTP